MGSSTLLLVFRHVSGARATEVDVVPLGAHRELVLGRAPSAAVRFDPRRDLAVGRYHARIEPDGVPVRFRICDLGSRNGTWLNGQRVEGCAAIGSGDHIRLGPDGPEVEFRIEVHERVLEG
jgi:pSer/pThr/pTyr-binding forkhead associated (FHA) protein